MQKNLFWTKLAKKTLKQKSEHHHQISHIANSLRSKYQVKLKIEKINITTEFFIFISVYFHFHNILRFFDT